MSNEKIDVPRNEATLSFVMKEKTRGNAEPDPENPHALLKGSQYPAPVVTEENLTEVVKWLSSKVVVKKIAAFLNQWAQGITEEVLAQKEGQFDQETFIELAKTFSARGETMKDLLQEREDLMLQLADFTDEELDTPEGLQKMKELRAEIKSVNVAIQQKKRVTKAEKEAAAAVGN